tara:strand:- start:223 stop:591 length:369 start_codon:yes stop_codon:yes gene_type:complete
MVPLYFSNKDHINCREENIVRVLSVGEDPLSDLTPAIQILFREWFPHNMDIVREFYAQSFYLKINGKRENYSSQMIVHKIRWDTSLKSHCIDYKINQNLGSALGRVVMKLDPRLNGMFRTKS